jgi:uncharacterized YigZ family protein
MDFYFTIKTNGYAEYKERGSRFLSYSYSIKSQEEFRMQLKKLKKEHPKAVHYTFAYRIGYDSNNFRVSDDGEPSGTSGKQILGQIDKRNLTDILVIVVRYFGGSLLGIPGLINAYKTAASLVLQSSQIIQKPIEVNYSIQFNYTGMNEIMRILRQYDCGILKIENQLFCTIEAGIPLFKEKEVLHALENISSANINRLKE